MYLKKEHRSIIPGGAMVTGGVCSIYLHHYIRVISLVQEGRDYLEEYQRHSTGGVAPRKVQVGGPAPRGEWPFAIDQRGRDNIDVIALIIL
jgi:hypothetical protein